MSLNPPIDTVQEVNVLRNSFSTEYGQGSAVVSMVTKSGTNAFNGTVYEYFRNEALDSKNYFAPTKPTHERNQFGVATGGPVMRNKLFFFGGYEGTRETNGEVQIATAITDQRWLQGDFSGSATIVRDPLTGQPFPGNIIPQARFSQFARSQIQNTPIANLPGATNNFRDIRDYTDNTDTMTLRLDASLTANQTTFLRFICLRQPAGSAGGLYVRRAPADGKEPGGRAYLGHLAECRQRNPIWLQPGISQPVQLSSGPGGLHRRELRGSRRA